jgi:DNA-binding response OmpR family regulator
MNAPTDILVVEDDPTIGKLLSEIFTLAGGTVRLAPTADLATAQLNQSRPSLMTLDLNLPGTSGQELLEQIRVCPTTRDLKVIVITSQLPVQQEVTSLAEAIVAKPFDLTELLTTVNQLLPDNPGLGAALLHT